MTGRCCTVHRKNQRLDTFGTASCQLLELRYNIPKGFPTWESPACVAYTIYIYSQNLAESGTQLCAKVQVSYLLSEDTAIDM